MKKILPALILLSLFGVLLFPVMTSAQIPGEVTKCKLKYDLKSVDSACTKGATVEMDKYGMCCLLNTLYNVTDWMFIVLIGIAVIFIIMGGFTFVTAGGSTEKTQSGRNYLLYAAVGILIGFLAKAIPAIVKTLMGGV
jgi:hypothetical protein